jgi:hypothetical protein
VLVLISLFVYDVLAVGTGFPCSSLETPCGSTTVENSMSRGTGDVHPSHAVAVGS